MYRICEINHFYSKHWNISEIIIILIISEFIPFGYYTLYIIGIRWMNVELSSGKWTNQLEFLYSIVVFVFSLKLYKYKWCICWNAIDRYIWAHYIQWMFESIRKMNSKVQFQALYLLDVDLCKQFLKFLCMILWK